MSVKVILSRSSDPPEKREFIFGEEPISLGRDPSNLIPLPGTQVSKHHARIEKHGDDYAVVDLNSTNCTYVNQEKVAPETPRVLRQGDKIGIADYELEVSQIGTFTSRESRLDHEVRNPSVNAMAVPALAEKHVPAAAETSSAVTGQWARLCADIQNSLEQFGIQDLARTQHELQTRCDALAEENRRLKAELVRIPTNGETAASIPAEPRQTSESRLEQVIQVLLQLFSKLSSGRSSFVSEFLVRTTIRTTNDLSLRPKTDSELFHYFTDPDISEKEFLERLSYLKNEADLTVLHMIGILEGYRRSVEEGARRILQRVDPDRLEEELPDTILLRYVSLLADLKLFRIVRNRLRDLVQEDRGVLEKQLFRPGFARAYVECVEPTSTKV
jgi:pSer/pThr/pTyr-binding forkhead associated (FHA) protein